MARPPIEWPIPAYVAEYRRRLVVNCAVPGAVIARYVPAPLVPDLVRGRAVLSVCLGNVRVLKTACGTLPLAGEFFLEEVVTPVRWQGACRSALRGSYLLGARTGSHGVDRFLQTALHFDVGTDAAPGAGPIDTLPVTAREVPWTDDLLFGASEEAEASLLHPEWCFVPDRSGRLVRAVPVHQYARATFRTADRFDARAAVATALGLAPSDVTQDHTLFQKRCTHTWSFPPEEILTMRRSSGEAARWPVASRAGASLYAA